MKRIRCPRCEEPILFDDSLYSPGRTLVFECPACSKQFKIKIPSDKKDDKPEGEERTPLGCIVVVENVFHLKQEIPIYEGNNVIGRSVKGTSANAAITTVDPSIDTTHCIINATIVKGKTRFILKDAQSNTGTFYMNHVLGPKETVTLADGDIITIGATTLIFKDSATQGDNEES